jgi:CheY-like chemotaxis protein
VKASIHPQPAQLVEESLAKVGHGLYYTHEPPSFFEVARRTTSQDLLCFAFNQSGSSPERIFLILPARATLPLILLAEDHPDDVFLMRLALQQAGLPNPLFVARDGQEALDYLAGEGPYADRKRYPFPTLLLLDLKMPRINGFEVLAWLQKRPEFDELPIVVLSNSDLEEDLRKTKELGADDYRVKPLETDNLVKMLLELHTRWLDGHSKPAPDADGSP